MLLLKPINNSFYIYFYHEFQIVDFWEEEFWEEREFWDGEVQHFQVVRGHLFMIVKNVGLQDKWFGNFKNEYIWKCCEWSLQGLKHNSRFWLPF